ncbi:hypothetical protein AB0H71_16220 [Nocardia sp. NPDC050697]|uniref:hypothetical protein n=1 Tax=Nocardia sp. NPDC050697 TaxID=3155158 RepID=UPI0033DB09B8
MRIVAGIIAAGVIAGVLAAGNAQAAPPAPDYEQPANGAGNDPAKNLTPGFSPVQVPPVRIEESQEATTVVAQPYLAPWVHDLVPLEGVELYGAARITLPGADGRAVVIAPSGHCDFRGTGTPATPIRIDTPAFGLAIDLSLRG